MEKFKTFKSCPIAIEDVIIKKDGRVINTKAIFDCRIVDILPH